MSSITDAVHEIDTLQEDLERERLEYAATCARLTRIKQTQAAARLQLASQIRDTLDPELARIAARDEAWETAPNGDMVKRHRSITLRRVAILLDVDVKTWGRGWRYQVIAQALSLAGWIPAGARTWKPS